MSNTNTNTKLLVNRSLLCMSMVYQILFEIPKGELLSDCMILKWFIAAYRVSDSMIASIYSLYLAC